MSPNNRQGYWTIEKIVTISSGIATILFLILEKATATIIFLILTFIFGWYWLYPMINNKLSLKPFMAASFALLILICGTLFGVGIANKRVPLLPTSSTTSTVQPRSSNETMTAQSPNANSNNVTISPATQLAFTIVPATKIALTQVPATEYVITEVPATQLVITQVPATELAITQVIATEIVPTPTSNPNILFQEQFDNNQNRWNYTSDDDGVTLLAQGRANITAKRGKFKRLTIPYKLDRDNFYIQAELRSIEGGYGAYAMGFSLGMSGAGYHSFTIDTSREGKVIFFDNTTSLLNTKSGIDLSGSNPITVALESLDGTYTLSVNNRKLVESFPLNKYGKDIDLIVIDYNCGGCGPFPTISFDNIIIKESR